MSAALLGVAAVLNDRPLVAVGVGFLGLLLLGTGLFQICPLYAALGVQTRPREAR